MRKAKYHTKTSGAHTMFHAHVAKMRNPIQSPECKHNCPYLVGGAKYDIRNITFAKWNRISSTAKLVKSLSLKSVELVKVVFVSLVVAVLYVELLKYVRLSPSP